MNSPPQAEHTSTRAAQVARQPHRSGSAVMHWLACGLGTGWLKPAPGTWGSLLGLLLATGLNWLPSSLQIALTALFVFAAIPICGAAARHLRQSDPSQVVLDEIVAVLFIYSLCPLSWGTALLGFPLFRLFDILKPWPISLGETLPGGWGIVADDLLAALATACCLQILLSCWPVLLT